MEPHAHNVRLLLPILLPINMRGPGTGVGRENQVPGGLVLQTGQGEMHPARPEERACVIPGLLNRQQKCQTVTR